MRARWPYIMAVLQEHDLEKPTPQAVFRKITLEQSSTMIRFKLKRIKVYGRADGQSSLRSRKSLTKVLNRSGFSRKQQCPVPASILCSAWGMSAAVRSPPESALSCSPFTISVGLV